MTKIEAAKELLKGHSCQNCRFNSSGKCMVNNKGKFIQKLRNLPKNNVCKFWEKLISLANDLFRVVRMGYPNSIAEELISVQPMSKPDDTIYHIDYKYGEEII